MRTLITAALAAVFLCACSSSPITARPPTPFPQPSPTPSPSAAGHLVVTITNHGRTLKYVSPLTKSARLTVTAQGAAKSELDTTANCTSTCQLAGDVPIGPVSIYVALYDGPNGTGNVLSSGATATTIGPGDNSIALTLQAATGHVTIVIDPSPSPSPSSSPSGEQAMSADAVVDSIGVNTHFSYDQTPYYQAYPAVSQMLIASGIRHIRDGGPGAPQWYYDRLNTLASSGIHSGEEIFANESDATIAATIAAYPAIEFVEGPNEYDTSGDPKWAANIRATQQHVYALKSQLGNVPVLGPSCAQPQPCAQAIGDLSGSLDVGNVHDDDTQCSKNPGNAGWGGVNPPYGTYGSESYLRNVEAIVAGAKPQWVTEQGYHDSLDGSCTLPDATIAKYDVRMVFERLLAGFARSYFYQLADQPNDNVFGDMGLLNASAAAKPQYTALKSLIALLADPGAAFAPAPLSYTLGGGNANLHHLVMGKRDGSHVLALWQEVDSTQAVAPLSLSLSVAAKSVTEYDYAADGSLSSHALAAPGGSYTLSVGDSVSFFVIA